ncbi:choice-of-anchor J domain-containing protein, partial [Myroides indicus]|uniref:choice-of-anchor J domain-containing protein n=1 Tax=Myroides indicus TaxID=1323422 RepID=UPI00105D596E
VVTLDHNGDALAANTRYEIFVRGICDNGSKSVWSLSYVFQTLCDVVALPFAEGFNSDSVTFACWTIIDGNSDILELPSFLGDMNAWTALENASDSYEGDRTMRFTAVPGKQDDWLISPAFFLESSKIYALKFFYKSNADTQMEILLSSSGLDPTNFTSALSSSNTYKSTAGQYKEKKLYITGISGAVNIAWYVAESENDMFIDSVSLEEVSCVQPENIKVKRIENNRLMVEWQDNFNSQWQYVVQDMKDAGGVKKERTTTANPLIIDADQNGNPLQPDTEYVFYLRSECSDTEYSEWTVPLDLKTACSSFSLPFWEGFNTADEDRLACWTIVDAEQDGYIDPLLSSQLNKWEWSVNTPQEGDRSAYFRAAHYSIQNDDWLISPMIKMEGKRYALSYYFMTDRYSGAEKFEVLLSENGIDLDEFTTVLQPAALHDTYGKYEKKTLYIEGINGDVNIAWRLTTKKSDYSSAQFFLDNILLEEIDCIPPNQEIEFSRVGEDSAFFSWQDPYNSSWEYYVSDYGAPAGSGVFSNTTSVSITRDGKGNALQPNTEYAFYVRSNCEAGKSSKWVGPVWFKTLCSAYSLPFWEGFNSSSTTLDCWRTVDSANDGYTWLMPPRDQNFWGSYKYEYYEGDRVASFFGENRVHDDWFISPTLKFEGKSYAITYYLKTGTSSPISGSTSKKELMENTHEVLLSTTGIDLSSFTRVLKPMTVYLE